MPDQINNSMTSGDDQPVTSSDATPQAATSTPPAAPGRIEDCRSAADDRRTRAEVEVDGPPPGALGRSSASQPPSSMRGVARLVRDCGNFVDAYGQQADPDGDTEETSYVNMEAALPCECTTPTGIMNTPRPCPAKDAESSVWTTAQICSRDQRKGRYVPASIYHPGKMLPAIARHAIAKYTAPGDIVADPMCGIGTTVVEAIHSGRTGFGVEYEKRWADLAQENVDLARLQGASADAMIWHGDGRTIAELIPASAQGKVALVITSPPYGPSTHGRAYTGTRRHGRKVLKAHHRYGENRDNLAYVEPDELAAGFTGILAGCAAILRPGGTVVITARPYRHHGELVNIPGMVLAAGQAAGLIPVDRCVALLSGVRDGHLVPRSSFFQIKNVRQAIEEGSAPLHVVQHEDLIIFNAPGGGTEVGE